MAHRELTMFGMLVLVSFAAITAIEAGKNVELIDDVALKGRSRRFELRVTEASEPNVLVCPCSRAIYVP
jgi:hypothetical protein